MDPELGCLNPAPLDYDDGDIAIWEIPLQSVLVNFEDVTTVYSRGSFSYRQKAQSGVFTLVDPTLNTPLDDFLKSKKYLHILHKYLIPKKESIIAMHDLHLMSINEGTMFPDGDGAARQANLGDYIDWISLNKQFLD